MSDSADDPETGETVVAGCWPVSSSEVRVRGSSDSHAGYGQWLVNMIVAAIIALFVALLVVGLTTFVDRLASPGIEIIRHPGAQAIVQVSGAVATPGVYELPPNARLADALAAAGGLSDDADATQLNLAARIGDGELITIPAISTGSDQDSNEVERESGLINVNTASAAELDLLPGVGPVIAGRIIDEREENGPFISVDSLTRVTGISTGTLDDLRPLVSVHD